MWRGEQGRGGGSRGVEGGAGVWRGEQDEVAVFSSVILSRLLPRTPPNSTCSVEMTL